MDSKGNNLSVALKYMDRGYSVIPIIPGQKKPMIKWTPFQKEKSTRTQIISWWSQKPDANIGIVTGPVSDLFVVDIDSQEGHDNLNQYGFDSIITPTCHTPRGGQHLYFKFPDDFNLTIGAGIIPGTDFRGEGGYVVAPPSQNGNGRSYSWVKGLTPWDIGCSILPVIYIKKLLLSIYATKREVLQSVTPVTSCDIGSIWEHGKRDDNLFRLANSLSKAGCEKEFIYQTLMAVTQSWGERDERWIWDKIESAFKRKEGKERNLHAEVGDFIAVTSGDFSVTSCYSLLQVVTKESKSAIRQSFKRYVEQGVIEKVGTKDGIYRRVEKELDFINFEEEEEDEKEYPIKLPLKINDLAEVCEGNIILVAGEYNAGKTTFLLNVLYHNKNKLPIRYISSEMGKKEFRKRFRTFYRVPPEYWKNDHMTDYVQKSHSFSDVIRPGALNIIDYLEFPKGDYTQGAEILTQIHDKLQGGVAVVAIQKKEGQRLPRSGDLVLEKPRLVISLTKVNNEDDSTAGTAEILKAKFPKLGKIDSKRLQFEIVSNGSAFNITRDWGYWRDWKEYKR